MVLVSVVRSNLTQQTAKPVKHPRLQILRRNFKKKTFQTCSEKPLNTSTSSTNVAQLFQKSACPKRVASHRCHSSLPVAFMNTPLQPQLQFVLFQHGKCNNCRRSGSRPSTNCAELLLQVKEFHFMFVLQIECIYWKLFLFVFDFSQAHLMCFSEFEFSQVVKEN